MIKLAEFKKLFLFGLIGSLIVAAIVAIIAVLIGEFNEVTGKVLLTLFMVVVHSLICLAFIWDTEKEDAVARLEKLSFFINILFFLIVLSFATSLLGIWEVIDGSLVWDLYCTYIVLGLASLHGNILSKAIGKEKYIDKVIYTNYAVICAIVLMLLPVIYIQDSFKVLEEFYFRLLGAFGIIDGTLSVLTIIFYKLHLHRQQANTTSPVNPVLNQAVKMQTSQVQSKTQINNTQLPKTAQKEETKIQNKK